MSDQFQGVQKFQEAENVEQEYRSHVWHYRPNRNSESEQHEFPLSINQGSAERAIASRLGLAQLPEGSTVGRNPLPPLPPKDEPKEGKNA